ncbi:MAG: hypothetical protein KAR42_04685 [candidate division Zixibacteria bacterium]|nr:hypothetical protein [candidate division Zixibacteria bacterium]
MSKKIEEIENKLTTNDIKILNQSHRLIDEILASEKERGDKAMTRVNLFIALSGAGLTIAIFLASQLPNLFKVEDMSLFHLMYMIATFCIFKATYYLARTLKLDHQQMLAPSIIDDLQDRDEASAKKYEIACKISIYDNWVRLTSFRLNRINRALRNLLYGFVAYFLFTACHVVQHFYPKLIYGNIGLILGTLLFLFVTFSDRLIDKKLWRWS